MRSKQPISDTNIELSDEFKEAFELLEETSENVFITGKAGTGKSTFLDYYRRKSKKNVVVLAPTGVAALNVRGQTIHSFFRFKPRFMELETIKTAKNNKVYKKIDVLVIDEISMVRADVFDGIERFLRLNGPKKGQFFGGVQLCVIGDLYQLPPVVSYNEKEIFHRFYNSPFFFSSGAYAGLKCNVLEFTKIYRQTEDKFISFLNRVRSGDNSQEVLDFINSRYKKEVANQEEMPIVLTSTNNVADSINIAKLNSLPGKEFSYQGKIEGVFAVQGEKLPAPEKLSLKIGAQVMFTKNDMKKRWVNGTIGTVSFLSERTVEVAVHKRDGVRSYIVEKEEWETVRYKYDEIVDKIDEEVTGSYRQYPLIPAWAITIHKSQGKTLDNVIIDLGSSGAFASGQLYVALSRCRKFENIFLRKPVLPRDVLCNRQVVEFHNKTR